MPLVVKLAAHTTEPARVVAAAAKLCYSAASVNTLYEDLDETKIRAFLKTLLDAGHLSPFEHASFTYAIEGVSRVATHQLVRHRIASYSQRSQRYVTMGESLCVVPPEVEKNPEASRVFRETAARAYDAYEEMISRGVPKEDARFILPHGWETAIVVTMNARELLHFFGLRLCRRAQWEIRAVARRMLALAVETAGELFEKSGPPCVYGPCRELHPCGRPFGSVAEVLGDDS
ncbi:MAG: FAD-dependent thymidylate synthase [Synergistaceae bacterium]|jgi:thymidylate synthase (FAD)|nr:FAD-dependent thymidylate synthase [Synergistaceae bacterium]